MVYRPTAAARRHPACEEDQPFWLWRLETWLVLSIMALVFQLFPRLFWGLLAAIDVRNWTWGVWVGVEIAVVVTLLVLYGWQKSD
jgi:hypothetical protein